MTDRAPGVGGLVRYIVAATLARLADAGGVVAIVLLVTTSGGPAWEAGLLGASITAPHLLGPFVARRLDTARDGRTVIAVASVLHGATLAAAVRLFPHVWTIVTAALLVASGLLGPLLTGGISSRLPAIAGPDRRRQRRAQGWDVATYGLAGTLGPSLVAVLSAWSSPTVAALVLAGVAGIAAVFARLLPFGPAPGSVADVPRPLRTLGIIFGSGPLRRTLYLTVIVALSVAVLPLTAVVSTAGLGIPAAAAGILIAAYGLGNLVGSAGVMLRPPRGEADRLVSRLAAAVALALALVGLSTTPVLGVVAYAVAGIVNAYFFAATLAARSEYSPLEARAQVFVWVGALKITAGSAGTAVAGAVIVASPQLPIILAVVLTLTAVVASLVERGRGRRFDELTAGRTSGRPATGHTMAGTPRRGAPGRTDGLMTTRPRAGGFSGSRPSRA
jgi:hypothetical protein